VYLKAGQGGVSEEYVDDAVAEGIADHVAQSDPHSQYAKDADVTGAIAAHEADPTAHPASSITNDSSVPGSKVADALDANQAANTATQLQLSTHTTDLANPHEVQAAQVPYDNSTSGLTATDVQGAIDENSERIDDKLDIASAVIDGGNFADTYVGSPFDVDGGSFV
jgi:hypothetical protein